MIRLYKDHRLDRMSQNAGNNLLSLGEFIWFLFPKILHGSFTRNVGREGKIFKLKEIGVPNYKYYTLYIITFTLHYAHYTLYIALYTMHITICSLHYAHYTMYIAHCTMHIALCTLNYV